MDMYREEAYVLTVGKLISGVDKLTSSSDEVTPVTGAAITNHNTCTQQDKFVKFQEFQQPQQPQQQQPPGQHLLHHLYKCKHRGNTSAKITEQLQLQHEYFSFSYDSVHEFLTFFSSMRFTYCWKFNY